MIHKLPLLPDNSFPSYCYRGQDPETGELLALPRTQEVEAIAYHLMQELAEDEIYAREGKMYGVLLVELPDGHRGFLKAFSGLLNGASLVPGWVPPIPGREAVAQLESQTLGQLAAIKEELIALQQLPARAEYLKLVAEFEMRSQTISQLHTQRQQIRRAQRQQNLSATTLQELTTQSQQDKREKKQLKRERDKAIAPWQTIIGNADGRIAALKQQRRELSRQLQAQMHAAYSLIDFAGRSRSLTELMPQGLPTGTGDCCAPKLLNYAAQNAFKPLAMAEFWWGKSVNDKIVGNFYPACSDRCQPIMGFLLSGLKDLPIIYEDEWIVAVNKPSGLLSVPGRYLATQDSVLSRWRRIIPQVQALHRLDLETSGILLLAKDAHTYSHLSQQFPKRQVKKVYEAILDGKISQESGIIDLPLWGNANHRPYQQVNWQYGKPSVTEFRLLAQESRGSRLELMPISGRTHQLRVHAADPRGLGKGILGDRLYGSNPIPTRLHLHARELSFYHPQLQQTMHLRSPTPF